MAELRSSRATEATVYGMAPAGARCVRCDETIPVGGPRVWVPGIDHRGPAHNERLSAGRALPDGDGSSEARTALSSRL
jgi:hypothetical protein